MSLVYFLLALSFLRVLLCFIENPPFCKFSFGVSLLSCVAKVFSSEVSVCLIAESFSCCLTGVSLLSCVTGVLSSGVFVCSVSVCSVTVLSSCC
ncbi:hypothetical protein BAZSYMA_ACONTIG53101_3 [Bathymodiolus azoricus thioautotrophic gill symbiont]|uniref:Uncharacterized protein n=1 Tax=Bathymodiolus azoricus thioautotrophic gill symbiont TaxID=235205 RepID=A0A1H6MUT5_9GAMM|nr:hypothetical protein BAZSYMA_ACONTIG53101_3 [Bathymodiolus azoricus thioautotrophic gill symbiont]